jgi:5-methylcytosine-specific restriction protein A
MKKKMRKYICSFPGCNVLLDMPGYCEEHKKEERVRKPFESATRLNSLFYNTTRWRTLRKTFLKENPYCNRCGNNNIPLQVHHKIPPRGNEELFFDEANLETICETCHRIITAQEIMERKK